MSTFTVGPNNVLFSTLTAVVFLFTCHLSWAQTCEKFYIASSLEARVTGNRAELKSILDLASSMEHSDIAKAIYEFSAHKKPTLSPEMLEIANHPETYLEFLGGVKEERGQVYLAGEKIQLTLGFDGVGFAQINLKGAKQLGSNPSRVYLSFHPELLKKELPFIMSSAATADASSLKFFVGSKENLIRPDRFIIGFNHPIKAFEFAKFLQKRYSDAGIVGDRVPFTFRVGNDQDSPVSFGKDINPAYEFKSWRGRVSDTLAEALSHGNTTVEAIRAYLRRKGINSDFWLPTGLVNEILQ